MHRLLVTGGTSYLGGRLIARLCAAGETVHALARPSSDRRRLPAALAAGAVHEHDGSTEALVSILEEIRPDAVIHLAGKYVRDHAAADVANLIRDNVLFGAQLLEAARAAGVRRFVHAASFFQHFDSDGYRPFNFYAATKQAFEDMLRYYADIGGLDAVTLVLFDTYGPGDWRRRLVPALVAAQETGKPMPMPADDPVLDLVHADDVIDAFLRALALLEQEPEKVCGGRFAVSSGRHRRLSEIVAAFERASGRPVPTTPGGWPASIRQIAAPWRGPALPGWTARIGLEDGLRTVLGKG